MGVTTALVGSVGSGIVVHIVVRSTQRYSDTMIRILLFCLVISLALGLPYGDLPSAAAHPAALLPHHADHHVVKRSPEDAGAESEPEAGEYEPEAEGEPEPEGDYA